ncbi:MAG: hypothetical protein Q7T03_07400 [Deltaproteobacteria bacterium]|nr:hypothetical protein [Deltaproteobacteria bacterium]
MRKPTPSYTGGIDLTLLRESLTRVSQERWLTNVPASPHKTKKTEAKPNKKQKK